MARAGRQIGLTAAALGLALAATARAEPIPARPAVVRLPGMAREILFLDPPRGWLLAFDQQQSDRLIREYVPQGQAVESWRDLVTVRIEPPIPGATPAQVAQAKIAQFHKICRAAMVLEAKTGSVNNLPAVQLVLICNGAPLHPTRPRPAGAPPADETYLLKFVFGTEALYSFDRAWHGTPADGRGPAEDPATQARWAQEIGGFEVCIPDDPARYCASLGLRNPVATERLLATIPEFPPRHHCRFVSQISFMPSPDNWAGNAMAITPVLLGTAALLDNPKLAATAEAMIQAARTGIPQGLALALTAEAGGDLAADRARIEAEAQAIATRFAPDATGRLRVLPNPACRD